jgi:hypothetical protein
MVFPIMKMKLGERKVQIVNGGFLISLPKIWIDSLDVRKGDRLNLEALDDGSLKISRCGGV